MVDKITLDRIKLLHPSLIAETEEIYKEICKALTANVICRFTHTLRTFSEQDALFAQGRTKPGKIVTNAKAGLSYHNYGLACFDEQTRIFTNQGIKHFYELTGDELVLTWKNGKMKYEKPLAYISNDYEGEMVSIKTRSVDLLVTPNHKMITQRKTNAKWSEDWSEVLAENLDYKHKIPTAGEMEYMKTEMPVFNYHKKLIDIKDSKDWWEFMGYYLSEGSVCGTSDGVQRKHNGRFSVKISQCKDANPEVWLKIKNCLNRLGFTYNYFGHDFVMHNKGLWEVLFPLGNCYQKHMPEYLIKADQEHLNILFTALVDGDGSYYDTHEYYISSSKRLAEDFLRLAILIGKSASMSSRLRENKHLLPHGDFQKSEPKMHYEIITRSRKTQELRNGNQNSKCIKKEYYIGTVYCVNTEAGAIIVERNGKTCIAGNCDIVLLIDKDKDGNYETASWDRLLDGDKDGKKDWQEIVTIFKQYGWEWGGDWKFKDYPHFQKTFGLSVRELLSRYNKKEFVSGKYVKLSK